METFFAQLFGLYFIIVGVIVLIRRRAVMPAITELAANRPLLLTIAFEEIVAGLALVLTFPTIGLNVAGVMAIVGYMLVIEGILHLAAPYRVVQKLIRGFNKPEWYMAGGVLAVVTGIYLVGVGFNLF